MNLNKRITEIEERLNPKPKPTAKVFTQYVNGTVKGQGLEFENKAEYDKYAEEHGLNDGLPVLFVEMVNTKGQNEKH